MLELAAVFISAFATQGVLIVLNDSPALEKWLGVLTRGYALRALEDFRQHGTPAEAKAALKRCPTCAAAQKKKLAALSLPEFIVYRLRRRGHAFVADLLDCPLCLGIWLLLLLWVGMAEFHVFALSPVVLFMGALCVLAFLVELWKGRPSAKAPGGR